ATLRGAMAFGVGDVAMSYAPSYYPGTASANEAQKVALNVGQELAVSFPLVAARGARITGVVRNSEGAPLPRSSVSLTQSIGTGFTSRSLPVQPDASFSISNVLPGRYSIDVRPGTTFGDAAEEYASMPIIVAGADINDLVVTTSRGGTIAGRVVLDTGTPSNDHRPGTI